MEAGQVMSLNTGLLADLILVAVPVFLLGWLIQLRQQNAGWVDVIWAFGVAAGGLFYSLSGSGETALRLLVGTIYVIWFGRLGWHLASRLRGEAEDGRYAYMRDWAGGRAPWVFLVFYLMQASWVWIFTLPAWLLSHGDLPSWWAVATALAVVIVAWSGEALADRQLARFKRDPSARGRTCRRGLWRYSRHPNYFFEWCHWFAYPFLGLATIHGHWLWLGPVVMFIFLYFVTGIPFTEQQALRSRGEDYRRYQQTTPMFFPWKPKQEQ